MPLLRGVTRAAAPVRGFFKRAGQRISDELSLTQSHTFNSEHLSAMAGPTSLAKIENDALKEGLDIWSQFDHGTPLMLVGEGTKENPFIVPSRSAVRLCLMDYSAEAPGVQGLGEYVCCHYMWEDGHGGEDKLNRCRLGYFYKISRWQLPETELATSDSHDDHFL
jgi:hypothetical protein